MFLGCLKQYVCVFTCRPAPSLGHSNNVHSCWILPNRWTKCSVGLSIKSISEAMCCYTRKCTPSPLCLPNRRTKVVNESVFHPIKRTPTANGLGPDLARFRWAVMQPSPSPSSRGETTSVEPRNTAVNHCPTQAPPKIMSWPVCSVDAFRQVHGRGKPASGGGQLETLGSCQGAALRQPISIIWNDGIVILIFNLALRTDRDSIRRHNGTRPCLWDQLFGI